MFEWAAGFEAAIARNGDPRPGDGWARVAYDNIGDATVSTVFDGVDRRYFGPGPPILFETMVLGGPCDGQGERYATWDEAEAGHTAMLLHVAHSEVTN